MIVLDTNVVSEPLRVAPSDAVITWLDAQVVETLYITTVTLAEIRFGIAALTPGRRAHDLGRRFEDQVVPKFLGRILSFDEPATRTYAELRAKARIRGIAIGDMDALIASIALVHAHAVATRDTAPFKRVGLAVINPFTHSQ